MVQVLAHCQPILKKVKGWRDTPIFARSDWWRAQQHPVALPDNVCALLDIIEHFTNSTIISIGNGPRGDEIIYLRRLQRSNGPFGLRSPLGGARGKAKSES